MKESFFRKNNNDALVAKDAAVGPMMFEIVDINGNKIYDREGNNGSQQEDKVSSESISGDSSSKKSSSDSQSQ